MPSAPPKPTKRSPRRDPVFKFYSRATALNHFLRRRVRPAGMGILILIIISAGAAAGNAEPAVFQAFALACSLVGVGVLWLPFRRAKVEAVRDLPPHATAGQR